MFEILAYSFMQKAFIGGLISAMLLSAFGVFMVLKRLSLITDGIAHIAFAGVAAGLYLKIDPLLTATATSLAGVLGIQALKQKKVYADAAIAILFSLGLSVGIILISLSKGFNVDLFSFLFGSILSITNSDLLYITALAIASAAILYTFYKEFFYITLNEEAAKVSGLPVDSLNLLMLALTALVVVTSIKIIGILLVTSLAIIPASAALLLKKSFKKTIFYSMLFASASLLVGLFASYYLNIAPSGCIVITAILIFLGVMAKPKKKK